MMRLLHTNCVPILYMLSFILTYGAQFKQYCARDSREANVAVNDCICKIFEFNRWLSIRDMPLQAGYKSIEEIFALCFYMIVECGLCCKCFIYEYKH